VNKVVYSQWSKPSKDDFVGFNSKEAFSNCAELSVFNSKKWFNKIELVTDEKGYKFLIEDLKLPFTSVKVELDRLNHLANEHWSIGKLYASKIQKEPFIHQDFDVIWFKKPPSRILKAQASFQGTENNEFMHSFYRPLMNDAKNNNYQLNKYCDLDKIAAYNCGIIGFNDLSIVNKWYDLAMDYIKETKGELTCRPIFFEQFLIYNLCNYYNFKVETIASNESISEKDCKKYGFTHLIAQSKRDPNIEKLVEKKLNKFKLFYKQK